MMLRDAFAGATDPLIVNYLNDRLNMRNGGAEELIANALSSRSQFLNKYLDPRRDIDKECGYPDWEDTISYEVYQQLYDREPIANRVVSVLPRESWQVHPSVFEDDDPDKTTKFEEAWDEIGKMMRGENSFYEEEEGSCVWEYLQRADEQCGIGGFGVILIGMNDGKQLSEPAVKSISETPSRELLFLRVFPESLCQITAREQDASNPRFGLPTQYLLSFDETQNSRLSDPGTTTATEQVHWTRVVHFVDNLTSSEVIGTPRLRPVLNRCLDIRKVSAGSAEMYWQGAFPGISLETHPQLGGQVDVDTGALEEVMEKYMTGLQRYLFMTGMSAKTLAPQVVDPVAHLNAYIEQICIQIGIPKRVFMGSERGELASSQDDAAWNDRLKQRQERHVTPRVIVPFVDRLIWLGILPKPKSYKVSWPDLLSQNESEKINIRVATVTMMKTYIEGRVNQLMAPMDFLTKIMDFSDEEAEQIIEAAEELIAKEEEEEMQKFNEMAGGDPNEFPPGQFPPDQQPQNGKPNGKQIPTGKPSVNPANPGSGIVTGDRGGDNRGGR